MNRNQQTQIEDVVVAMLVDTIGTDIISGRLAPGSDINSVELASRFGTSRTPIREALLILDRYGLVSLSARKRPRVAQVSIGMIEDIYGLRRALHVYVVEAIVRGASDEELEQLCQRALILRDGALDTPLEQQFYRIEEYLDIEHRLGGNSLVMEVLGTLKWRIGWVRRLALMSPQQMHEIAEDRVRVACAYKDRDAPLAAALNSSMLRRGAEYSKANYLANYS